LGRGRDPELAVQTQRSESSRDDRWGLEADQVNAQDRGGLAKQRGSCRRRRSRASLTTTGGIQAAGKAARALGSPPAPEVEVISSDQVGPSRRPCSSNRYRVEKTAPLAANTSRPGKSRANMFASLFSLSSPDP